MNHMRIAYQGEPGAFSEAAALQIDAEATLVPCRSFEDVFDSVKGGPAGHGVLPIENSIGGSIHRNFDLLLEHDLPIVGEVEVPVVHHLLAFASTTLDRVRRVYSHPQALALVPLRSSIQDYEHNFTRFIVIGRRPVSPETPDKTTIVFTLPKGPGTLFKALSVFALRGIDLTKLESRPIPNRKWEYLFYADVAAARDELPCGRALAHLAEFAPMLRVLGSYPSY